MTDAEQEHTVCSFHTAVKLKELGVPQRAARYWAEGKVKGGHRCYYRLLIRAEECAGYFALEQFAAFGSDDVWGWLPEIIRPAANGYLRTTLILGPDRGKVVAQYRGHSGVVVSIAADTLAETLCRLLIWLIQKGHVEPDLLAAREWQVWTCRRGCGKGGHRGK